MNVHENIIREYFNSWINNDYGLLKMIFSKEIVYVECYGPEYHGINQILKWFYDWNKRGKVIEWSIKQFINTKNTTAVEWYFKCEYDNVIDGFDGVSIIKFDEENKIIELREFQSKKEHYLPYKK